MDVSTAVPDHRVRTTHRALQQPGYFRQHKIAGEMTELGVDILEAIDIHDEERHRREIQRFRLRGLWYVGCLDNQPISTAQCSGVSDVLSGEFIVQWLHILFGTFWFGGALLTALAAFIVFKYLHRREVAHKLAIPRITPDLVKKKMDGGEDLLVVDVRSDRITTTLEYASGEEACIAAFAGGPVAMAYSRFDEPTRDSAYSEYLDSIAACRHGDGYAIPGEFVVTVGHRR